MVKMIAEIRTAKKHNNFKVRDVKWNEAEKISNQDLGHIFVEEHTLRMQGFPGFEFMIEVKMNCFDLADQLKTLTPFGSSLQFGISEPPVKPLCPNVFGCPV